VTRFPGAVSGTCGIGSRSPWPPPFAPPPPLPVARRCSAASLLLRRSLTSHAVHHRLRFLTFPMRTSRLCSLWPDMRSLRFRRVPFGRDGTFDPGGATASRIAMPHILPSTVPSVSASATFFLSWLNPPPHPITVYASHPPSPTTAQHSLPGSALPPYRGRSFTGRNASASPDAPEPKVRIHLPPAESQTNSSRKARVLGGRGRAHFSGCAKPFAASVDHQPGGGVGDDRHRPAVDPAAFQRQT
jgi:hypothetical protein